MILAISGSLAVDSTNVRLLRAQANLLAEGAPGPIVEFAPALDTLPHFHPDRATAPAPEAVRRFKERIAAADGILLSSPEYAHGIPGVLKNALDWIVATGELSKKPILLSSVSSTGGPRVLESLHRVLTVMEGEVRLPPLSFVPAHVRAFIDPAGRIVDPGHDGVARLLEAIRDFKTRALFSVE